jgi:hypothetical protein
MADEHLRESIAACEQLARELQLVMQDSSPIETALILVAAMRRASGRAEWVIDWHNDQTFTIRHVGPS